MTWLGRAGARKPFWIEAAFACLWASLALVTLVGGDWIELVFGVHPDNGSGALEWGVVAVFSCASIVSALLARREWRRPGAVEGVR